MRRPNHIILDFETNNSLNSNFYWASNILSQKESPTFLDYINVSRKYHVTNPANNNQSITQATTNNTIRSNNIHKATLLKDWEKRGFINIYKSSFTSNHHNQDTFNYLTLSSQDYTKTKLKSLLNKYNNTSTNMSINPKLATYANLININFLRKERLYTKLKYSRSPAYDIVSGGAAALLAGFIGFLISEKFGYELVDSGDFYYAFMYGVFLVFSIRPLLTVSDSNKGFLQCLSLRNLILFYTNIIKLIFKKFK